MAARLSLSLLLPLLWSDDRAEGSPRTGTTIMLQTLSDIMDEPDTDCGGRQRRGRAPRGSPHRCSVEDLVSRDEGVRNIAHEDVPAIVLRFTETVA